MFKSINLLIILMLAEFLTTSFAQTPEILWERNFGGTDSDEGNAVQQTSDDGFIVFGSTESSGSGGVDAWLIKTDSAGNSLWTKTIGFNQIERSNDGQETFNGDLILTGYTNSVGAGLYDVFLARTNSSGDTLWTKTYGSAGYESGNAVFQFHNGGGFIIAGEYSPTVTGLNDAYIVKTNSSGNLLWEQTIGGKSDDVVYDVRQNSNDDFIITGFTNSFGNGNSDVWLICLDAAGNTLYTKTFGGSEEDVGRGIVQTSDGGCAIAGWTYSFGSGYSDVYLIRTDASGDTLWTKTYGESDNYEAGYSLVKTPDGGFIISGVTVSVVNLTQKVYLVRTDSLGNEIWTKTIEENGGATAYSIRKTSDDGIIVSGAIVPEGRSDTDVLLIRLGPETLTGIDEENNNIISDFKLHQNYPNPFNPSTKISWQSSVSSWQSLKIYDVLGNEIATLVDEYKPAGSYEVEFNAGNIPSGIYFYKLTAGSFTQTNKMLLLK